MKYKICEIAEIIDGDRGKNYPKQDELLDEGYCLFLNTGNVTKTGFSFNVNQYITKEKSDSLRKGKLERQDIVYTTRGTVGNAAYYGDTVPYEHIRINSGMVIIRPKNEIVSTEFLYQLLKSEYYRPFFKKYSTGSAQPQLPIKNLSTIELDLPVLPVQVRIASILSAYDDLIENNQKQIRLLEEAAERLYREWFVALRFPGHETTPVTDGVPDGWEKAAVESKVKLLSGYAFKSSTFDPYGKYKIVTIKNVKDAYFEGENISRIAEIPRGMPNHCKLFDGDILLSLTGNVGRVCIVTGDDYLLNQRVAKLQSSIPAFAYCLFRSKDMREKMNNLANGAAQQNLSPIRVGQMQMLFPREELILRFEKIVQPMMQAMINANKNINKLSDARDRLLPKLMSGEIEV